MTVQSVKLCDRWDILGISVLFTAYPACMCNNSYMYAADFSDLGYTHFTREIVGVCNDCTV